MDPINVHLVDGLEDEDPTIALVRTSIWKLTVRQFFESRSPKQLTDMVALCITRRKFAAVRCIVKDVSSVLAYQLFDAPTRTKVFLRVNFADLSCSVNHSRSVVRYEFTTKAIATQIDWDKYQSVIDTRHVMQQLRKPARWFVVGASHDGVQLPIDKITTGLKASSDLRFVLVDGAQHLAHGDLDLADMDCDFYLAGTHKWLRSLYPLGVAAYGHPRSKSMIKTVVNELLTAGIVDDPLLRFTSQLENAALSGPTETINLSGLLSAHGAAVDASPSRPVQTTHQTQGEQ